MDFSPNRVLSYISYRWHQRVRLDQEFRAPLVELLALLNPQKAQGVGKVRIGAGRDGGYVMLDDFEKIGAALSLGIGPDVSWDFDIAEKNIPVWQYDHTVNGPPKEHSHFRFERKRIVSQASSADEVSLTSLLEKLAGQQLIAKIDIEGDEWEILSELPHHLLANCRQIVVEFHNFVSICDPSWRDKAGQALILLARDFGVVHVHGNNLSKHLVTDGFTVPDSLEVTFANRQCYNLQPTEETFPGPLDKKNNPYFPDFKLGRFQFAQDHAMAS